MLKRLIAVPSICGTIEMPVSGKEVVRRLRKVGWVVVSGSGKGSHVKMRKGSKILTVPFHGNRDLGRGLLAALERQSGEKLR